MIADEPWTWGKQKPGGPDLIERFNRWASEKLIWDHEKQRWVNGEAEVAKWRRAWNADT